MQQTSQIERTTALEHPLPPGIRHSKRLDPPRFYHGTTRLFAPGDHVLPSSAHGEAVVFPSASDPAHAYATTAQDDAWWYAEHAWAAAHHPGPPRVYQVEPLGFTEEDPQFDGERSRGNLAHDVRSRHGFLVLHEEPMPEELGEPQEWR